MSDADSPQSSEAPHAAPHAGRSSGLPLGLAARPPAVVLGLSATGLGVVRSLARLGVEVHGVYADPASEIARHSRHVLTRHRLTDPGSDEQLLAILARIRELAGTTLPMPVFPTSDRYAKFLSAWREELEPAFTIRVPGRGTESAFLDKRATEAICRRHGIRTPRTCSPDTIEDVERAASTFDYPVIIKPSGAPTPGFPGKNAIADNAGQLVDFYRAHPDLTTRTVFQELIESGDGHILYVATYSGAEGKVLARVSFRKLRQWLPDRGVTSYGVSEIFPELLESTTAFLDAIEYVGFTGVEFAEDARTGQTYFLELNARAVLPNQLFVDSGVDLTAVAYLEMCGAEVPSGLRQRDGVYWMNFLHDIPSSVVRYSRRELGICAWLRDAWRATSFASWDRLDPKPFAASALRLAATSLGLSSGKQVRSVKALRKTVLGR